MEIIRGNAENDPTQIVLRAEADGLDKSEFMQTLAQRNTLSAVWALMANTELALSRPLLPRMLDLMTRTTNNPVRSILASQFNDELGNGDYTRAHGPLFPAMLAALAPYRPPQANAHWLEPGDALRVELDRIFAERDTSIAVGSYILLELYSQQASVVVANVIKAQPTPPSDFAYVTLHAVVEIDHVEQCIGMAKALATKAERAAAWHGAERTSSACKNMLSSLERLCFT